MMMMLMIFFFSCKYSIYSLTRINRPSCDNINGFFTYIAVGYRLQHMVIRSKMTINGISLVFLYITVVPVQICHIILFQKNLLAAVTVAVFHCFPTPKRWMLRRSSKPPCQRPCSYWCYTNRDRDNSYTDVSWYAFKTMQTQAWTAL